MNKSQSLSRLSYLLIAVMLAACGGSRDEIINGIAIPVPRSMKKAPEKPVEFKILGFGAGQASFRGDMDLDKLIEFYKKQMSARGWKSTIILMKNGASLAFTKDGNSILIVVNKGNNETDLSLTVSGVGK